MVLSIDSRRQSVGWKSQYFDYESPCDSKTIADLHAAKVGEDNVLICLNNARGVYAEDNNYIPSTWGGPGAWRLGIPALCCMQGTVCDGFGPGLNVSCSGYNPSTSDVVGETNSSQLEITGEVAEEPIPVFCPSVRSGRLSWWFGWFGGQQWIGAFCSESDEDYSLHYVYLSNSSDFDLKQYGFYDITLWYNAIEDLRVHWPRQLRWSLFLPT